MDREALDGRSGGIDPVVDIFVRISREIRSPYTVSF